MSTEEIKKLAEDPNSGLTTDQLEKLKQYRDHRDRTEKLVGFTKSEYEAYEENQTKKGKRKNKDVIVSRNLFRRGISGGRRSKKAANSGAKQTQANQLQAQIDALDLSDPSNIAKRKKLMKKKADLQAQVNTSEDWTKNNNSERRKEIRQERKEIRQRHMQVKHRRAKAIEEGGDLSEDGIRTWISNYNEQEYKKKKKQEQEDKEQKEKEAKEKQDKRDKLYGGNSDDDKK